jgi:acetyltransferase-like isoleucine patch superfamily enzyme
MTNSRNLPEESSSSSPGITELKYLFARLLKKLRPNAIHASSIHKTATVESGSQIVNTTIGRHSFCGYDCAILNAEIGAFCSISDTVYIGGAHHPMHFVSTSPVFIAHRNSVSAKFSKHAFFRMDRTVIGNDVWIGAGAKIRAGISIGTGSVVGLGSVVVKDVPPYAIVGGNPAVVIGMRFPPDVVSALLTSSWWEFDDQRLREAAQDFVDPLTFLKRQGLL